MLRRCAAAAAAILLAVALDACGKPHPPDAIERGRIVYVTRCIVCHNADPNRDGNVGPAVAGSSRELIADRVLHLSYPPGYHPRRDTHAMRAIPDLTPAQIDDLTAYLHAAAAPHPD